MVQQVCQPKFKIPDSESRLTHDKIPRKRAKLNYLLWIFDTFKFSSNWRGDENKSGANWQKFQGKNGKTELILVKIAIIHC